MIEALRPPGFGALRVCEGRDRAALLPHTRLYRFATKNHRFTVEIALLVMAGGALPALAELNSSIWARALARAAFLPWLFLVLPWAVTVGSPQHVAMSRAGILYWTVATACLAVILAVAYNQPMRASSTYSRSALMVAYATLFGCASLLSACIPLPRGYSVSPKSVAAKSGTHTLLADDGSTCKVSEKVFAEVDIGDVKTCTWGRAGESDGAGTPTGVQGGRRPPITSKPPR